MQYQELPYSEKDEKTALLGTFHSIQCALFDARDLHDKIYRINNWLYWYRDNHKEDLEISEEIKSKVQEANNSLSDTIDVMNELEKSVGKKLDIKIIDFHKRSDWINGKFD